MDTLGPLCSLYNEMAEDSEFPPGFPNKRSSSDNHRQQAEESVSFQAETKLFFQQEFSGKWKVEEVHRQGVREIVVPINSRQWISKRLRWKGSNPGIYTSRLRLVIQGVTVYITEKSNRWGIYIAIQVKDNQSSSFVIIPGGRSGELWGDFASWLCPEGVESWEPAVRFNNSHGIGVSATQPSNPLFYKSYAEAVQGGSHSPHSSVIESLQKDISLLKANVQSLTEQVCSLGRKLEMCSNDSDVGSRFTGGDDDTLIQNTVGDDEAECLIADAQPCMNCDAILDIVTDLAVNRNENVINQVVHMNTVLVPHQGTGIMCLNDIQKESTRLSSQVKIVQSKATLQAGP